MCNHARHYFAYGTADPTQSLNSDPLARVGHAGGIQIYAIDNPTVVSYATAPQSRYAQQKGIPTLLVEISVSTSQPTFEQYALVYDLVYRDKPYDSETDYLEALFRRFHSHGVRSVLDIAAGTGSHLNELAKRGYECTGSDLSANMISLAKRKAVEANVHVDYAVSPMQSFHFDRQRFDAILCMFSAIDYLNEWDDLLATLKNVRNHLQPGGLFVFDYWNGIEASKSYSPLRVRECRNGDDWLIRVSRSTHEPLRNTIQVEFDVRLFHGDTMTSRFLEQHSMRYFYPRELQEVLSLAGFHIVHTCPFMELDKTLSASDWNVSVVATTRD